MYDYCILPSEGIIIQRLTGTITVNDLKEMFLCTKNDPMFSDNHSYVTDFRNAKIALTIDELKVAAEYLKENSKTTGRTALLVNRSVDTAKLLIFRDQIQPNFYFSVFSSVEGASNFLKSDLKSYLKDDFTVREDVYI